MSNNKNESFFTVNLPVFKQGDDFCEYLNKLIEERDSGAFEKAFSDLSEQYKEASEICKKLSSFVHENKENISEVGGDTHWIWMIADSDSVSGLVSDGILLQEENYDEEDYGEETSDQKNVELQREQSAEEQEEDDGRGQE